MQIPLTLRHKFQRGAWPCGNCKNHGLVTYRSAIEHPEGTEYTTPFCEGCMADVGGEVVVLEPQKLNGTGPPSRAMQRKSQRRERQLAEAIGGRAQPGSGNQPHAKGDVRLKGQWLIQDKTSRNKSFSLTRQLINEVRSQCSFGENFAIVVGFLNKLTQREEDEVVVIDRHVWEAIVNAGENL